MDFLLLLPHGRRVVLEVDGAHHRTAAAYADTVRADRELKVTDADVYRFGAVERTDLPRARLVVEAPIWTASTRVSGPGGAGPETRSRLPRVEEVLAGPGSQRDRTAREHEADLRARSGLEHGEALWRLGTKEPGMENHVNADSSERGSAVSGVGPVEGSAVAVVVQGAVCAAIVDHRLRQPLIGSGRMDVDGGGDILLCVRRRRRRALFEACRL